MTLLSRKVDYAILILSYLHQRVEGGSAREIAARFELSRSFVANILKMLCHKGFVTSHRGVKGGYVLQRPADEVKLAELMDALDEGFHLMPCTKDGSEEICSLVHTCPVRRGDRGSAPAHPRNPAVGNVGRTVPPGCGAGRKRSSV